MKLISKIAIALLGMLSLTACGDGRFPDYNYKMTIHVATPSGEKTFSSVRAVTRSEDVSLADSSGRRVNSTLVGEAVIIDIPARNPVFALLDRPESPRYANSIAAAALYPVMGEVSQAGDYLDVAAREAQAMVRVEGPQPLPRTRPNADPNRGPKVDQLWPMLVTFRDMDDPKTVREVSPDALPGGGRITKVTIAITDEDVTTGIEERLPPTSAGPFGRQATNYKGESVTVIMGRQMFRIGNE